MERSGPRPASWTPGGVSVVALLALAWLGTTGAGLWIARGQAPQGKAESSGLQVLVTDGVDARLWLERPGAPPRAMPLSCETAPGPVVVRVARRTGDDAWRQDTVELALQPGRLHLLPIGGQPLRIEAQHGAEPPRELPWRHPFPGTLGRAQDGTLGVGDPAQQPVPLDTKLAALPDSDAAAGWLPARERLLVAANPFLKEIRISVAAQHANRASDWRQECTLPAFGCRVFALGAASGVKVSCTRVEDGAALGEGRYAPPAEPGRPVLYTVGGATVYAWLGSVEGRMPSVPSGEWAELPPGLQVRARQGHDPKHWILVAKGPGGAEVGLAPFVSAPLVALGPAGRVQARADVVARELALPTELRNKAVGAVAAAGGELWGIVDGVVHDLRTGKPLHAREPALVAQMAATPHGLVLITRTGRLATLADGRVVTGASVFDPTLRLAPAAGDPPAVWLYGGTLVDATLVLQPLDGSGGSPQTRSGGHEEAAASEPGGAAESSGDSEEGGGPEEGEEGEGCGEGAATDDGMPADEAEATEEGEATEEPDPGAEAPPSDDGAASETSPSSVTAMAAAGGDGALLASGRRIERLRPNPDCPGVWGVDPVLTLPEEGPDVIGLLDLEGRLLFATEECVYELRGNLVLPLVEGIGGPLVPWRGGLVVCDARSGRLYHLSGAAFLAPKGAPR